jgi:hypothetical protein
VLMNIVGILHIRYPCVQNLKHTPMTSNLFLVSESSGSATYPEAQSTSPVRRGLRCHHVLHSTECATHQERAPVSPRASRHRARHLLGKDSGVATCLDAPSPSPSRRGLQSHHVPHGSRPASCTRRLWRHYVTEAPESPPGRAPVSPHVL